MDQIHPDLMGHYTRNEAMWKLWQQHGINEQTPINVDFQFVCPKYDNGIELKKILEKEGLNVNLRKIRKFIFFIKGDIEATMPTQTWSLQKIQEYTTKYFNLSIQVGCDLDGLGAFMPK